MVTKGMVVYLKFQKDTMKILLIEPSLLIVESRDEEGQNLNAQCLRSNHAIYTISFIRYRNPGGDSKPDCSSQLNIDQ